MGGWQLGQKSATNPVDAVTASRSIRNQGTSEIKASTDPLAIVLKGRMRILTAGFFQAAAFAKFCKSNIMYFSASDGTKDPQKNRQKHQIAIQILGSNFVFVFSKNISPYLGIFQF